MSIASIRSITHQVSGDESWQLEVSAAENANSPAQNNIVTLVSGANTITPPSGGTAPKGVTIIPPAANTAAITLKGISGDTGILLHPTDPTSIGLGSTTGTFVLAVTTTLPGIRFIWS